MKSHFWLLILLLATALSSLASSIETPFFKLTTPDDSWQLSNDGGALGSIGTRVLLSRSDGKHEAIDLARIDYLDLAFSPRAYLQQEVVGRRDIFVHDNITLMGQVADTTFKGLPAQRVHFDKQAHDTTYRCVALAFNAGYGTFFIIQARRQGTPPIVGRVVAGMEFKCDATQLTTVAELVKAATATLKRRSIPLTGGGSEVLKAVHMPDTTTVEFTVMIPYLKQDAVEVPLFVQAKRDQWMKTRQSGAVPSLLLEAAMRERKDLRYTYVDDHNAVIGSLLIMAEEYESL